MADSQKMGSKVVSGGQRIDDHKAWMGAESKQTILPMGVKFKTESSAVGAGSMAKYEDTTEAIKRQQEIGINKIKSHPRKPEYRE